MSSFFEKLENMAAKDEGGNVDTSLGIDSLMSISHAEIIDSTSQFDDYLKTISSYTEKEEGQLLVSSAHSDV